MSVLETFGVGKSWMLQRIERHSICRLWHGLKERVVFFRGVRLFITVSITFLLLLLLLLFNCPLSCLSVSPFLSVHMQKVALLSQKGHSTQ